MHQEGEDGKYSGKNGRLGLVQKRWRKGGPKRKSQGKTDVCCREKKKITMSGCR